MKESGPLGDAYTIRYSRPGQEAKGKAAFSSNSKLKANGVGFPLKRGSRDPVQTRFSWSGEPGSCQPRLTGTPPSTPWSGRHGEAEPGSAAMQKHSPGGDCGRS